VHRMIEDFPRVTAQPGRHVDFQSLTCLHMRPF